jgi:hypothetical protein
MESIKGKMRINNAITPIIEHMHSLVESELCVNCKHNPGISICLRLSVPIFIDGPITCRGYEGE